MLRCTFVRVLRTANKTMRLFDSGGVHFIVLPRLHLLLCCVQDSSRFLVQVNMFRAGSNQEAIVMEDAVKYLRASKFNASKAIDIYKNHQVLLPAASPHHCCLHSLLCVVA